MFDWRKRDPSPPPLEHTSALSEILHQDVVAAFLLLSAAVAALVMVNTGLEEEYHRLVEAPWGVEAFGWQFERSFHFWINEGLMAVFFFLVGLEIKRELLAGELASVRRATLPAVAAVGGMLCPAVIFALLNAGEPSLDGWGVPMATDIAFAIGCISLVGRRVPVGLSVFLIALAIVDDLGAVVVIALFYTERLALRPLLIGGALIGLSYLLSRLGVRATALYVVIWVVVWVEFLESGVHATVAGVLLALTIPAQATYKAPVFLERMRTLLDRFDHARDDSRPTLISARQQDLIRYMFKESKYVEPPLQRIEHSLHPITMLVIMPLFAFANSGVHIHWAGLDDAFSRAVAPGVILGLLAGKQLGIMLFSWAAVKLGIAELPKGVNWIMLYGVSWLAGIGFTMALFISQLAFGNEPVFLDDAKIGIFTASSIGGLGGILILRWACSLACPLPAPSVAEARRAALPLDPR